MATVTVEADDAELPLELRDGATTENASLDDTGFYETTWQFVGEPGDTIELELDAAARPSDTITVTGGAQHVIDTTNIRDVILAPGAVFDPSCGLNPVAGEALVVEVGADDGGGDEWSFHEECDGRADRLGGLLRNSVAVDLLR